MAILNNYFIPPLAEVGWALGDGRQHGGRLYERISGAETDAGKLHFFRRDLSRLRAAGGRT